MTKLGVDEGAKLEEKEIVEMMEYSQALDKENNVHYNKIIDLLFNGMKFLMLKMMKIAPMIV